MPKPKSPSTTLPGGQPRGHFSKEAKAVRATPPVVVDPAPSRRRSGPSNPAGIMKMRSLRPPVYRDPRTGKEYGTRAELTLARRDYNTAFHRQFIERLTQGTLTTDAWDKLPGETPIMYARFRAYLTMDPKLAVIHPKTGRVMTAIGRRSVERVAYHIGRNVEALSKTASQWHWKMRADAWDAHLDKEADLAFVAEKRSAARRQAKLGAKLQELAGIATDNHIATRGLDVSASEIAKLADVGVKLERLAHGDSTSNDAAHATTVLVWQGAAPKWAGKGEVVVEQIQADAGPTGRTIEGGV